MSGESTAWLDAYHGEALSRRRRRTHGRKLRRLGLFGKVEGQRTLDIACGAGESLHLLAAEGASSLFGVDLFAPVAGAREPFHRIVGDGTRLPFGDDAFDRILCMHALHHFRTLPRIDLLLAEARRLLKPDGALFLVDHFDSFYLRSIFRLCAARCPLFPAPVEQFGVQLREEWDCIGWWLDNWRAIFPLLESNGFDVRQFSRGLFFFYLTCKQKSADR